MVFDAIDRIRTDELSCDTTRRVYEYWISRHQDGRLPGRADIEPLDLGFAIGNLVLMDVLWNPLQFRYRLAGTKLTTWLGFELTGLWLHEHPDWEFSEIAHTHYAQVAEAREPLAARFDKLMDDRVRRFEVVLLPLAKDGETVDMILVCQCFT